MKQNHRPLSPHLQIYKPQFTSVMSILHRLTGIAAAFGLLLLTWWLAVTSAGGEHWHRANAVFANPLIVLILFLWSAALIYHLCNGIRHLIWDAGHCLTLTAARKAGRVVQIATAALTLLLWIAIAV